MKSFVPATVFITFISLKRHNHVMWFAIKYNKYYWNHFRKFHTVNSYYRHCHFSYWSIASYFFFSPFVHAVDVFVSRVIILNPVSSLFLSPTGITVDRNGAIYFVDGTMIRKVDRNGIISTVLGSNDLTSARPLTCDTSMHIRQVTCKDYWILAFMWMLPDRAHPGDIVLTPGGGQCALPRCKNSRGTDQRTWSVTGGNCSHSSHR